MCFAISLIVAGKTCYKNVLCVSWYCLVYSVSSCMLSYAWAKNELGCPKNALCSFLTVLYVESVHGWEVTSNDPLHSLYGFLESLSAWVLFPNETVIPFVRILSISIGLGEGARWLSLAFLSILMKYSRCWAFFTVEAVFLAQLRFDVTWRPRNL